MLAGMDFEDGTASDRLWEEYGAAFREFDDLSLARWMCQTLGQMEGKAWRISHPLIGAYRLCAYLADKRQIWLKRLATPPVAYPESDCCRAPVLPLLTRDVLDAGLLCQHCAGTLVPFADIPEPVRTHLDRWAQAYKAVHAVAHWDDAQRAASGDYEQEMETAATAGEDLLKEAGTRLAPMLLEHYPTVIWEDHDECLLIRPEDIRLD